MAGVQGLRLAVAVSNAGGLARFRRPAGPRCPGQELTSIRAQTVKPFNVNFFCHTPPIPDADARRRAATLAPYYEEFGLDTASPNTDGSSRSPFGPDVADVLDEFRPAVVKFHFGLPSADCWHGFGAGARESCPRRRPLRSARWLEAHGVDAIIAQGFEAGGHRGIFLSDDLTTQVGTWHDLCVVRGARREEAEPARRRAGDGEHRDRAAPRSPSTRCGSRRRRSPPRSPTPATAPCCPTRSRRRQRPLRRMRWACASPSRRCSRCRCCCSRWCRRCSSTAGSGSRCCSPRRSSLGRLAFHRAALVNLRHGAVTMDTLISLGTLAAWTWSVVVALLPRRGDPYFEVAAVVTVLILLGRYLEAGAKSRAGAALRALVELGAKEAHVLRDGVEVQVPIERARGRRRASSSGRAARSRSTASSSTAPPRSTRRC